MTALTSRAQAAPLLRVLRGCARGAMRPQETRDVGVAPDAAQKHAASSAAGRSGTLAQAEASPHAQARRESSRRGAQHSCYPLVHHGTRRARGQRAAWRRTAAQKSLQRTRTSEACRGSERPSEQPGATHAMQIESRTTQGVSTAHLTAFQRGGSFSNRLALIRRACCARPARLLQADSRGPERESSWRCHVRRSIFAPLHAVVNPRRARLQALHAAKRAAMLPCFDSGRRASRARTSRCRAPKLASATASRISPPSARGVCPSDWPR